MNSPSTNVFGMLTYETGTSNFFFRVLTHSSTSLENLRN